MPNFKPKVEKKIAVNKKATITLDKRHSEHLKSFEDDEKHIEEIKKKRKHYLRMLKHKKFQTIDEKLEIQDLVDNISKEIKSLRQKAKDYKLENTELVFNYFEKKKNISVDTNKKTILNNFFKKTSEKETETNKQQSSGNNRSGDVNFTKEYLRNVDDRFLTLEDYTFDYSICERCGGEMVNIDHEGVVVCKNCSYQKPFLIEHDKPSYKEPPKEVSFYAYKRINHFREILSQFQGKESTQIDLEIIENIKKQIKKERISLKDLTNEKTKELLKRLQYNNYYEHIPFIKDKLGIKPPVMSVELETTLCNLFMEIQKPYAKFCPNDRQNFLNYYYVLYKMCELLGEDQYLDGFYMLKDPIKRMEQDEVWKKICKELNWEFIPTP